jgi:hypothetical protein
MPSPRSLPRQVDVERKCSVVRNGKPCRRDLACKRHSMAAKRSVAGRSVPFDMLLEAYIKKEPKKSVIKTRGKSPQFDFTSGS